MAQNVLWFWSLESLLANLSGPLALLAFGFVIVGNALAKLLGFS